MIPQRYITQWRQHAPWQSDVQVEQDLLISRALIKLYEQPKIADSLIFRGGTALNKLYLKPPARYSEDLDFIQIKAEPIGETLLAIRVALDDWLGNPTFKQTASRVTFYYRFTSENDPMIKARIKIEINTREHLALLGLNRTDFAIKSDYFTGAAPVTTLFLEELMASKLRALYERKKSRDLFDMWVVNKMNGFQSSTTLELFHRYMQESEQSITRAMFEKNMTAKMNDPYPLN